MSEAYAKFSKDDFGVAVVYAAGNYLGGVIPLSVVEDDIAKKLSTVPKEFVGSDYYETGWPYFWNGTTSVSNISMAQPPKFYVIDGATMEVKHANATDANFALIQSLIDG